MSGAQAIDTKALINLLRTLDDSLQKGLRTVDSTAGRLAHQHTRDMVSVFIRVVFIKIGDIETLRENFVADAYVQARWREPRLDGKGMNQENELLNWGDYWNPKLYVDNCLGEPTESIWYHVSFDDNGEATIYERRRIKATFFETMELYQYPFDTQELSLVVTSHLGEHEVELQPDPSEISTVNVQSFVDQQEWTLHRHITSKAKVTTDVYKSTKHKHPALVVSCRASRRYPYFIWNIILIMIFICSLIFTTFVVDVEKVQNRLQLSFILLLSNITFKFNISQTLPKVAYVTKLDIYVITSMAILSLVCVWHATVYLVFLDYGAGVANTADTYGTIVIGAIYVIFNVGFITTSVHHVRTLSKKLTMKDLKQKKMMTLMGRDTTKRAKILPLVLDEEIGEADENTAE